MHSLPTQLEGSNTGPLHEMDLQPSNHLLDLPHPVLVHLCELLHGLCSNKGSNENHHPTGAKPGKSQRPPALFRVCKALGASILQSWPGRITLELSLPPRSTKKQQAQASIVQWAARNCRNFHVQLRNPQPSNALNPGPLMLAGSPQLTTVTQVTLTRVSISSLTPPPLLYCCPNLRHLVLDECKLTVALEANTWAINGQHQLGAGLLKHDALQQLSLNDVGGIGKGWGMHRANTQWKEQLKQLPNLCSLHVTNDTLPQALLNLLAPQLTQLEVTITHQTEACCCCGMPRYVVAPDGEIVWRGEVEDGLDEMLAPEWHHVVGYLRQCPKLRTLRLSVPSHQSPWELLAPGQESSVQELESLSALPAVCKAAPQLEELHFEGTVAQEGVDALLAMPQLTSLTVQAFIDLTKDLSERKCRWQTVHMTASLISVRSLAWLPMKQVTSQMRPPGTAEDDMTFSLVLPRSDSVHDDLAVTQAAARNLPADYIKDCPVTGFRMNSPALEHPWNDAHVARLLHAIKPIVKQLYDKVMLAGMPVGQGTIAALADMPGASDVHWILLHTCMAMDNLWRDLLQALPNLNRFELVPEEHPIRSDRLVELRKAAGASRYISVYIWRTPTWQDLKRNCRRRFEHDDDVKLYESSKLQGVCVVINPQHEPEGSSSRPYKDEHWRPVSKATHGSSSSSQQPTAGDTRRRARGHMEDDSDRDSDEAAIPPFPFPFPGGMPPGFRLLSMGRGLGGGRGGPMVMLNENNPMGALLSAIMQNRMLSSDEDEDDEDEDDDDDDEEEDSDYDEEAKTDEDEEGEDEDHEDEWVTTDGEYAADASEADADDSDDEPPPLIPDDHVLPSAQRDPFHAQAPDLPPFLAQLYNMAVAAISNADDGDDGEGTDDSDDAHDSSDDDDELPPLVPDSPDQQHLKRKSAVKHAQSEADIEEGEEEDDVPPLVDDDGNDDDDEDVPPLLEREPVHAVTKDVSQSHEGAHTEESDDDSMPDLESADNSNDDLGAVTGISQQAATDSQEEEDEDDMPPLVPAPGDTAAAGDQGDESSDDDVPPLVPVPGVGDHGSEEEEEDDDLPPLVSL